MGKSAYAQCGQTASVGVPVGCVRIAMASPINKILLRKHGWELPNSFTELEVLAVKAKEAGMDEHLSKPMDISALEQTVKRFRVTPENK